MKINIYVVHDVKVEAYHKPFFARSDEEAKRIIYQTAMDKESNFYQYPAEFNVSHVGQFDEQTGEIEAQEKIFIGSVLDIFIEVRNSVRRNKIEEILADEPAT